MIYVGAEVKGKICLIKFLLFTSCMGQIFIIFSYAVTILAREL